jgi:hypothetical protein
MHTLGLVGAAPNMQALASVLPNERVLCSACLFCSHSSHRSIIRWFCVLVGAFARLIFRPFLVLVGWLAGWLVGWCVLLPHGMVLYSAP